MILKKVPDSDGDGGSFVRLPLVLPGSAPHHHVSVLQLLGSRRREPRAAFTVSKHQVGHFTNTDSDVPMNSNTGQTHVLA